MRGVNEKKLKMYFKLSAFLPMVVLCTLLVGCAFLGNTPENLAPGVYDRATKQKLPTVGPLYACESFKLREIVRTRSASINAYNVFGEADYYTRESLPWYGQNYITPCKDKSVVSPIDGIMQGRQFGPTMRNYVCGISGTGLYEGLFVGIMFLAEPCTKASEGISVERGDIIGKQTDFLFVMTQWGTGTHSIDAKVVPFHILLDPRTKLETYEVRSYIDASTPPDSSFDWIQVVE